jgi:hypothetical protein
MSSILSSLHQFYICGAGKQLLGAPGKMRQVKPKRSWVSMLSQMQAAIG